MAKHGTRKRHVDGTGEREKGAGKRTRRGQSSLEDLEARTNTMEQEWAENEKKFADLDGELQEVWTYKEALEKERGEVCISLH